MSVSVPAGRADGGPWGHPILDLFGPPAASTIDPVLEDYAGSEVSLGVDQHSRCAHDLGEPAGPWAVSSEHGAAPAQAIVRVLDQVNQRCGSMVGFARGIGVELEVIEALHRQRLA